MKSRASRVAPGGLGATVFDQDPELRIVSILLLQPFEGELNADGAVFAIESATAVQGEQAADRGIGFVFSCAQHQLRQCRASQQCQQ